MITVMRDREIAKKAKNESREMPINKVGMLIGTLRRVRSAFDSVAILVARSAILVDKLMVLTLFLDQVILEQQ